MLDRLADVFKSFQEREVRMGQEFFVISKRDLIAPRRASGRPVDLEDARLLELPEPPSS